MKRVLAVMVTLALTCGCTAPTATIDLINVAKTALDDTLQAQVEATAEIAATYAAKGAVLDAGFDADVILRASGQMKDDDGKPKPMTAEWVISARKGYIAGHKILAEERLKLERQHAIRLDNIKVGQEALDMAKVLIVQSWNVAQNIKQFLLTQTRRE